MIIYKNSDSEKFAIQINNLYVRNKRQPIKVKVVYIDGTKKYKRLATTGDGFNVIEMKKGARRYGSLFNLHMCDSIIVSDEKSEEEIWRKSWEKALKYLRESGLWSEIAQSIEVGLDIGLDKIKKAHSQMWEHSINDYSLNRAHNAEKIQEIDPRFMEAISDKNLNVNNRIIEMINPAKIKKMYFGKGVNTRILSDIEQAMRDKTEIRRFSRAGYDVSFSYMPEGKAWYSEEYRNCGNGHYYIALNSTHALFYEDD